MNPGLTKTEKQILLYISIGLTSKQIADALYVAKSTVDKHRKNMLKKLGVSSSAEMVSLVGETL